MAYGPCRNQNCSSYGKPHPNCKCYGGMAKGGDVKNYCSSNKPHKSSCQYFAEGGEAELDPKDFVPDNTEELDPADFVPDEPNLDPKDFVPDSPHGTGSQQALTALEGVGQGVLGPIPAAAEYAFSKIAPETAKSLSLTPEDMAARAEENPKTHYASEATGLIGGLMTGVGEAALASKVASKIIPEVSAVGKIGAMALQGALTNVGIAGGDEATNWILGQEDPNHGVASSLINMGVAGLFGLGGGAIGGVLSNRLQAAATEKLGSKISPFLEGVEAAARGQTPRVLSEEANIGDKIAGSRFYHELTSTLLPTNIGAGIGAIEGARQGYEDDGIGGAGVGLIKGAGEGAIAGWAINAGLRPIVSAFGKRAAGPIIGKILSSGTADGIGNAINYVTNIKSGADKLGLSIGNLFKAGSVLPAEAWEGFETKENRDKKRQELSDFIENNGLMEQVNEDEGTNVQAFAEGGHVENKTKVNPGLNTNKIGIHFPDQGMLLAAAKGRITNYLSSIQPTKNSPKLAFDSEPDQTEKKRSYNKALDVAISPLSVISHIKNGTVEPDHVKHLNSMYPEIYNLMSKKLTDKIVQSQMDDEKPSYKTRQGLSLFLGTALSGELVPQNIQAAQAVFMQQKAAMQGQGQPEKNSKSSLSKASSRYLTTNQAAQQQAQKLE